MATIITDKVAEERDTFPITVAFTDENDDALTPNSGLTWKLTDMDGNVINDRQAVAITPDSTITIVLSGDDLALAAGESDAAARCLLITGTYNSDLGTGLDLSKEIRFIIAGSRAIPNG